MPLSGAEQEQIQQAINFASEQDRRSMKLEAEEAIFETNAISNRRLLSSDESKAFQIAIEMLVRLEATEHGKGWLFRARRRVQLTHMYMGG